MARFHETMREHSPELCWYFLSPHTVCILRREHDVGEHELPGPQPTPPAEGAEATEPTTAEEREAWRLEAMPEREKHPSWIAESFISELYIRQNRLLADLATAQQERCQARLDKEPCFLEPEHEGGHCQAPSVIMTELHRQIERAERYLKDFLDFGTRHDLNPTLAPPYGREPSQGWGGYLKSMDNSIRERAEAYFDGDDTYKK